MSADPVAKTVEISEPLLRRLIEWADVGWLLALEDGDERIGEVGRELRRIIPDYWPAGAPDDDVVPGGVKGPA